MAAFQAAPSASTYAAFRLHRLRLAPRRWRPAARPPARRRLCRSSFLRGRLARLPVEPVLRRREAREAGHRSGDVDRLPFWIESRNLQSVDATEQAVSETSDPLVAVGPDGPVV